MYKRKDRKMRWKLLMMSPWRAGGWTVKKALITSSEKQGKKITPSKETIGRLGYPKHWLGSLPL